MRLWKETCASGMNLGILAFFATLITYPREIIQGSERDLTIGWISIIIVGSALGAFFLASFWRRVRGKLVLISTGIVLVLLSIYLISQFLYETRDIFEPWIVQAAWFFRQEGISVGLFLGAVAFQTIFLIAMLIDEINSETPESGESAWVHIAFLAGSAIAFFAALNYFYMDLGLGYAMFFIFLAVSAEAGLSILAFRSKGHAQPRTILDDITTQYHRRTKSFSTAGERLPPFFKAFDSINAKLERAGTERLNFWWMAILLFIGLGGWVYFLLNPPGDGREHIVPVFVLFGLGGLVTLGSRARRQADWNLKTGGFSRRGTTFFCIFDILSTLGVAALAGMTLYGFPYMLYFPEVMLRISPFLLVGVLLAYKIRRRPNLSLSGTFIALMGLALHFWLVYTDASSNAFNYYDGNFDIIFPFEYLHHWPYYLLVGLSIGFLLTRELYRIGFQYTDGGDANVRSLFVTIGAFVLGFMTVLLGEWSSFPGGEISYNTRPEIPVELTWDGFWFPLLGIIVAALVAGCFICTQTLLPWLVIRRRRTAPIQPVKNINIPITESRNSGIHQRQTKLVALAMIVTVSLAAFGGYTTWVSVKENRSRPLLAMQPGNFTFWLQNSSERVAKDTQVDLSPENLVDAVDVYLAKNEYESFQVVIRPDGKGLNWLGTYFTDFRHVTDGGAVIPASEHSIRIVDYVMNNEFPDILKPFDRVNLLTQENHVFWVTVRVPYTSLAGTYRGNLTFLFNNNERVDVKINLHVWNFSVPLMRHLRTNIGSYTVDPALLDTYTTHRMNTYGIPINRASSLEQLAGGWPYTCYVNWTTSNWTFNWAAWDAKTQDLLDRGMNAFSVTVPVWLEKEGRDPVIEDPYWMAAYANFCHNASDHLTTKGWLNYSYIYFIDEFQMFTPEGYTPEQYHARLLTFLQTIKAAAPDLRIMTTTPPTAELGPLGTYFDIYCPIATDRNKTEWDARLAAGYEMWFYECVGPKAPWANSHLYNRLYETRVQLWQAFLYRCQGFLYWSSTAYYHGQYGLAYNGWGDGWFIYPAQGGGWWDSIRWENYRDAQEDYEYLWLLNASITWFQAHPGIKTEAEVDALRTLLNEYVGQVAGEREVYCDHPQDLYDARMGVGNLLESIAPYDFLSSVGEAPWYPPTKIV